MWDYIPGKGAVIPCRSNAIHFNNKVIKKPFPGNFVTTCGDVESFPALSITAETQRL